MKFIETFESKGGRYRGTYFGIDDDLCEELVNKRYDSDRWVYLSTEMVHTLRAWYNET